MKVHFVRDTNLGRLALISEYRQVLHEIPMRAIMAEVLSGMRSYWSVVAASGDRVLGEVDLVAVVPGDRTYITAVEFKSSLRGAAAVRGQRERARLVASLFGMWLRSMGTRILGWSYSVVVWGRVDAGAARGLREEGVAVLRVDEREEGGKAVFFRSAVRRGVEELDVVRAVRRTRASRGRPGRPITVADFVPRGSVPRGLGGRSGRAGL